MKTEEKVQCIFQNIQEGIVICDENGYIQYINQYVEKKFSIKKGHNIIEDELEDVSNTEFMHTLQEQICKKKDRKSKVVKFYKPGEEKCKYYEIKTSASDNDVVATINDVTDFVEKDKQKRDLIVIFVSALALLCCNVYLYSIIQPFSKYFSSTECISYCITSLASIVGLIIIRQNKLSMKQIISLSSNTKATVKFVSLTCLIASIALVLVKIVMLNCTDYVQNTDGFFNTSRLFSINQLVIYPIEVFLQEVVSRAVFQDGLENTINGKHKTQIVIIAVALVFGSIHVHYGMAFMAATVFFAIILGEIYAKFRSIPCMCAIHYVVASVAFVLFF